MNSTQRSMVILFFSIAILPMLIWVAVAVIARKSEAALRTVLPFMNNARWASWGAGVALVLVYLIFSPAYWLFACGMGLASFSIGLGIAQGWVKRRVAGFQR